MPVGGRVSWVDCRILFARAVPQIFRRSHGSTEWYDPAATSADLLGCRARPEGMSRFHGCAFTTWYPESRTKPPSSRNNLCGQLPIVCKGPRTTEFASGVLERKEKSVYHIQTVFPLAEPNEAPESTSLRNSKTCAK